MFFGIAELILIMFFGVGGAVGAPLGIPPGPENPLMSRIAPEDCIFYTTWSPTVAPDASKNPTEAWMAQPEIKASVDRFRNALFDWVDQEQGAEREISRLGLQIAERCLRRSVAIYLTRLEFGNEVDLEGGLVFDLGPDARAIKNQLDNLAVQWFADDGGGSQEIEKRDIDGIQVSSTNLPGMRSPVSWAVFDETYLFVGFGGDAVRQLLANKKTPAPEWLNGMRERIPVERIGSVTYANIEGILELTDQFSEAELQTLLEITGLNQIGHMGWICGLDDQGFIMRSEIMVDGPPRGLLGLIDGAPLKPEDFAKVSDDKMLSIAVRLSPVKLFELYTEFSQLGGMGVDLIGQLNQAAGIDFEKDIVKCLDDYAYFYGSISLTNPTAGWVLAVGASDKMSLAEPYAQIISLIKSAIEGQEQIELKEDRIGSNTIYSYGDEQSYFMPSFVWTLSDGELLMALNATSVRRHLRRKLTADDAMIRDEWYRSMYQPQTPGGSGPVVVTSVDLAQILQIVLPFASEYGDEMFPEAFNFSFDDLPSAEVLTRNVRDNVSAVYRTEEGFQMVQRQTYPGGSPGASAGAGLLLGMSTNVQVRRESARAESMNRMRQVLLAIHNYESTTRFLPARFSKNAENKPLLSWRVHLLPFLDEQDLYDDFKLDEPWDSEHNKKLIDRIPDVYRHPKLNIGPGKTVYVVPTGNDAVMVDPNNTTDESKWPQGSRFLDVTDGTSNTVILLEANEDQAVTWTKPDDYKWADHMEILDGLRGNWGKNIILGFCDGSVRSVHEDRLGELIELLLQKSDGQVVDLSDD